MKPGASSRDAPPTRHSNRTTEGVALQPPGLHRVPEVNSREGSVLTDPEDLAELEGEDSDDDVKMIFASDKTNKAMMLAIKLAVQESQTRAEYRRKQFQARTAQIQQRIERLNGPQREVIRDDLEDDVLF